MGTYDTLLAIVGGLAREAGKFRGVLAAVATVFRRSNKTADQWMEVKAAMALLQRKGVCNVYQLG